MDVILYICNPCIQEAEEGGPRVSLDGGLKKQQTNTASLCMLLFSSVLHFRFRVEMQRCQDTLAMEENFGGKHVKQTCDACLCFHLLSDIAVYGGRRER